MVAAMAFVGAAAAAHAGPCATQISQVDQQIRMLATSPPRGAGDPSAPQSVGAQLHHQPTPGSVQRAEPARVRKLKAQGHGPSESRSG
jgi:hypothetical protein